MDGWMNEYISQKIGNQPLTVPWFQTLRFRQAVETNSP